MSLEMSIYSIINKIEKELQFNGAHKSYRIVKYSDIFYCAIHIIYALYILAIFIDSQIQAAHKSTPKEWHFLMVFSYLLCIP